MLKRMISLFLCMVMMITMLPAQAFSEEMDLTGQITETEPMVEESASTEEATEHMEESTVSTETVTEPATEETVSVEETVPVPTESAALNQSEQISNNEAQTVTTSSGEKSVLYSGSCGENVNWTLDSEGVFTISGEGPMKEYGSDWGLVPWYDNRSLIQKVVVEDGVTTICDYAFYSCQKMTEVVIGDTVETIGTMAFSHSNYVTKLTVGKGLKTLRMVGLGVFNGWVRLEEIHISDLAAWCTISGERPPAEGLYLNGTRLTEVEIPDTITSVEGNAFSSYGITRVVIPQTITRIGSAAFSSKAEIYYQGNLAQWIAVEREGAMHAYGTKIYVNGELLEHVIIPNGVFEIGDHVFRNTGIKSISIPDTVQHIGESAFYGCQELAAFQGGNGIKTIGREAFWSCTALPQIRIADSVTDVGDYVFYGCTSLTSMVLSEQMKAIPSKMALGCSALKEIVIPASVESIGSGAFEGCTALNTVKFHDDITTIGERSFYNCTNMKVSTWPTELVSVGQAAFYNCAALKEIVLHDQVEAIGASAFSGCSGVEKITLSANLSVISEYALNGCSGVAAITIPAGVTAIEKDAFKNCTMLKDILFEGDAPAINETAFASVSATCFYPAENETYTKDITTKDFGGDLIWTYKGEPVINKCGDNIVWNLTEDGTLQITGTGAMYDYSTSDLNYAPWYEYRESIVKIQVSDGVTDIGNYAFYDCNKAGDVSVPGSVVCVGDNAFYKCGIQSIDTLTGLKEIGQYAFAYTNISSFTLPETITKIGVGAFARNYSLRSAVLPDHLETIPDDMFYWCAELENVTYPTSLKHIGNSSFYGCIGLRGPVLPEGLISIGKEAFNGCGMNHTDYSAGFSSITLPSTLETIGEMAFHYCQNLKSIAIPEKVKVIPKLMLGQCYDLTSVILPAGLEAVEQDAFIQCKSLQTIRFKWNAPTFADSIFTQSVYAKCYYPSNNKDWTPEIRQQYGGNITWVGEEPCKDGHQFGEWQEVIPADCENPGKESRFCSECGEEEQKTIDPKGHQAETDEAVKEGCTEDGKTEGSHCSECDKVLVEQETIPATGHTVVKDEGRKETCTEDGLTDGSHCSGCGEVVEEQKVIPAHGHKPVTDQAVPESCTEDGLTEGSHCSVCGKVLVEQEVIPAPGHQAETDEAVPPTCVENGLTEGSYCGVCEQVLVEQEIVLATGIHSFQNSQCEYCGLIGGTCGEDVNWVLSEEGVLTITGTGAMQDYDLVGKANNPNTPWYDFRYDVIGINVSEGITHLGKWSFGDLSCEWISLPESLVSMGRGCLYGCYYLRELEIPDGVVSIESSAFAGCGMVTSLKIPDSITGIADYTFSGCTGLEEIILPDSVASIGEYAFRECVSLEEIILPEAVTSIGAFAFEGCYRLDAIDIPTAVTTIGQYAFRECEDLTEITIPNGITAIENGLFESCIHLKSVTLPDTITKIGSSAFQNCAELEEIVIPESVTVIGASAFSDCSLLTDVTIEGPISVLPNLIFNNCYNLEQLTIPESVTEISMAAFKGCDRLGELTIPRNVRKIDMRCFMGSSIYRFIFEGSAPEFRSDAFYGVTAEVYYPSDDETWTYDVRQNYGGTITWIARMSQADLEKAMEQAAENWEDYYLEEPVTLVRDFDTGNYEGANLYIFSDGSITVPDGVTLTIDEDVTIVGGSLLVKKGGSLVIKEYSKLYVDNGSLKVEPGANLIIEPGQIVIRVDAADTNIDRSLLAAIAMPFDADSMNEAMLNAEDYCSIEVMPVSSFAISENITIPENAVLQLNDDYFSYAEDVVITVPDGKTLVNNGRLLVRYGGTLEVLNGAYVVNNGYFQLWSDKSRFVVHKGGTFINNGCVDAIDGEYINDGTEDNNGSILRSDYGYGICGDNLSWEYDGTTSTLRISGSGDMYDYTYKYDDHPNPAPWTSYYKFASIIVEEGITRIGDYAFGYCYYISQIDLPEGLLSIGENALPEDLANLDMPASLESMEYQYLPNLKGITVSERSTVFTAVDGILFSKDMTKLIKMPQRWIEDWNDESFYEYVVPEGVREICAGALENCDFIKSIILPDSLEVIGDRAVHCYGTGVPEGPETVIIPAKVKSIGSEAFGGLKLVVFTGDAPEMAEDTFHKCAKIAYYPANNATWTPDKLQNYGGDFEWIPYEGSIPYSGKLTDSISWRFDEQTNTLTIIGKGVMPGYSYSYFYSDFIPPWHHLATRIESVVIGEGITEIGYGLFKNYRNLKHAELSSTVRIIGDYAFLQCDALKTLILGEGVTNIGICAFMNCNALENVRMPERVNSIGEMAFCGCESLTEITFTGDAPRIGLDTFCGVTANASYPVANTTWDADVMQDYGGNITWIPVGTVKNRLIVEEAELNGQRTVWIDGKEYPVQRNSISSYVDLPDDKAKTMVVYTMHEDDSLDIHTRYPVGMKVWTLRNEDGVYHATRVEAFDDILQYSGMSIRVYGRKGIRMITSMEQAKKNALVNDGLAGYTLKEYGTIVAWANQLSDTKPLVLGKSYVKSNYAYKRGIADPVFQYSGNLMQYTNVLVNFTDAQCADDLAMRSYMILEDAQGNTITLYGGVVQRSIGYIAYRNRNVFEPGSDEYEYVWGIIRSVYGTMYDDDYKIAWTPPAM